MARGRAVDPTTATMHKTLSKPGVSILRMLIPLALVGFLAFILSDQLVLIFQNSPFINGLIVFAFGFGVLYAFHQVTRLYREIRWVNAFRIADPGLALEHRPILLAPMATMLRDRRGHISLSTTSMRSIMESIGSRLDEARDTGRYLVGLLVFLGLLGTFWGLLDTIQSVGKTIAALDTSGGSSVNVFDDLKNGLAAPLRGMGTAFSSSLLGLAGSLVLGYLDLQAAHAHNRFYNELEEWLSGITELTPGGSEATGGTTTEQLTYAIYEMQRALNEMNGTLANGRGAGTQALAAQTENDEAVQELARGVDQLVRQMRAEQKVVREWVDEQAAQQSEVASVLKDLAVNMSQRG
ncbi:MAG: flagellar motor protein MotA [Pseudomonadota bacterium]